MVNACKFVHELDVFVGIRWGLIVVDRGPNEHSEMR